MYLSSEVQTSPGVAGARTMTLGLTILAGTFLALITYSAAGPWF